MYFHLRLERERILLYVMGYLAVLEDAVDKEIDRHTTSYYIVITFLYKSEESSVMIILMIS